MQNRKIELGPKNYIDFSFYQAGKEEDRVWEVTTTPTTDGYLSSQFRPRWDRPGT